MVIGCQLLSSRFVLQLPVKFFICLWSLIDNILKNCAMLEGHHETDEDTIRQAAVAAISHWFPVMPTLLLALSKLKDNFIAPCPH